MFACKIIHCNPLFTFHHLSLHETQRHSFPHASTRIGLSSWHVRRQRSSKHCVHLDEHPENNERERHDTGWWWDIWEDGSEIVVLPSIFWLTYDNNLSRECLINFQRTPARLALKIFQQQLPAPVNWMTGLRSALLLTSTVMDSDRGVRATWKTLRRRNKSWRGGWCHGFLALFSGSRHKKVKMSNSAAVLMLLTDPRSIIGLRDRN